MKKHLLLTVLLVSSILYSENACKEGCSPPPEWVKWGLCTPETGSYSYAVCIGIRKKEGDENASKAYIKIPPNLQLIARQYEGVPLKTDRFSPYAVDVVSPEKIETGSYPEAQVLLGFYEATGDQKYLKKLYELATKKDSGFAALAIEQIRKLDKKAAKYIKSLEPIKKVKKTKKKKIITEIPEDEFFELRLEKDK